MSNLRVIDFFCGAGGFSEGFRQQGFRIVRGVDFWQPAIDTHNLNHNSDDVAKNVLDFWGEDSSDIAEIEKLENTEFLIGSPSCTSFSMSNRAGKADKVDGLKLIESYLRVIAVKKHQKQSILKAWYMENVPKSRDFMRQEYTFKHLNLAKWAKKQGLNSDDTAIRINGEMLNAGDYGAPQERKRFIAGEWIETGKFISPRKTHETHKTMIEIRSRMPKVNERNTEKKFVDPNYPSIEISAVQLTDHFYDTGVYKIEWEKAKFLKTNHPFMGKMSFPENDNRTSRTIMATRSASTREALLYNSEYKRKDDGKYRLPTIREIASLMGFPYTYQFVGSESVKWRQVGNAVCPHQSAALAKALREEMGLAAIPEDKIKFNEPADFLGKAQNLNTFKRKKFDCPRERQANARFRRHPLKIGNMTVDLMNYHPDKKDSVADDWYVAVFFGTGNQYRAKIFSNGEKQEIENTLEKSFEYFHKYKQEVRKLYVPTSKLQQIYEEDLQVQQRGNPILFVEELSDIITSYDCHKSLVQANCITNKKKTPLAQLMSAYGLMTALGR